MTDYPKMTYAELAAEMVNLLVEIGWKRVVERSFGMDSIFALNPDTNDSDLPIDPASLDSVIDWMKRVMPEGCEWFISYEDLSIETLACSIIRSHDGTPADASRQLVIAVLTAREAGK